MSSPLAIEQTSETDLNDFRSNRHDDVTGAAGKAQKRKKGLRKLQSEEAVRAHEEPQREEEGTDRRPRETRGEKGGSAEIANELD